MGLRVISGSCSHRDRPRRSSLAGESNCESHNLKPVHARRRPKTSPSGTDVRKVAAIRIPSTKLCTRSPIRMRTPEAGMHFALGLVAMRAKA